MSEASAIKHQNAFGRQFKPNPEKYERYNKMAKPVIITAPNKVRAQSSKAPIKRTVPDHRVDSSRAFLSKKVEYNRNTDVRSFERIRRGNPPNITSTENLSRRRNPPRKRRNRNKGRNDGRRNKKEKPNTRRRRQTKSKAAYEQEWERNFKEVNSNSGDHWGNASGPEPSWVDKVWDVAPTVLEHVLPLIAGMGDYSEPDEDILKVGSVPSSNSLLASASCGKIGGEVPYMHSTGEETRCQHREYLGDVYSTTSAFTTSTFTLNPGMNETNPWLAPIANQYQAYRYLGMNIEFVSEGSEYTNSAGLGYVALATQYNVYAAPFADKREMLNTEFADAAKPSKSFCHWIECKPSDIPMSEMYTRAGNVPAGADKRLYDLGTLTLAVGGNTASNAVIGELWATYDVEFYLPKTSETSGVNINYFNGISSTGVTNAVPYGTALTVFTANNTFTPTLSGNVITFPNNLRGNFLFDVQWGGTVAAVVGYPVFTPTNCNWMTGYGASTIPLNGVTSAWMSFNRPITITQDGASVSVGVAGTLPTGTVSCYVTFYQIPSFPPTLEDGTIFDRHGVNRQSSYDKYMEKFKVKETPKSDFLDVEDYLLIRETKLFILEEDLETNKYYICCSDEDGDGPEFRITEKVANAIAILSDEEFDCACKAIILEKLTPKSLL